MFAEIIRNFVFRMEKVIKWNNEKNKWLKKERKLSFEAVLIAIDNGKLLDIVEHPDKKKYNGQKIFIVEIEKYVYMIPFI